MDFQEFERDWKMRHRGSIPRKRRVSSWRQRFWIGFWIVVAMGSAVFSGTHTIPAAEMTILNDIPGREVLAITAFIIVELVIFGAAAGRHEIRWLKWLLLAAVAVALMGNISSSVQAVSQNGGNELHQAGGLLLSVIAPITALAAGEVLHYMLDNISQAQENGDADYEDSLKKLDAVINTAWLKHQREHSDNSRLARLSEQTDNRQTGQIPMRASYGHERTPDGQKRVVEYLADNPDDASLPLRTLAERIGVNKDTVRLGRILWQQTPLPNLSVQTNGNGHHPPIEGVE